MEKERITHASTASSGKSSGVICARIPSLSVKRAREFMGKFVLFTKPAKLKENSQLIALKERSLSLKSQSRSDWQTLHKLDT